MSIARKVRSVEKIFRNLEKDTERFTATYGIHCLSGCGACCTKPDIHATPLEFLPLAYHYLLEGKAEAILERIESGEFTYCHILQPFLPESATGYCGNYPYRGLICRLFGLAARRNKYGELELATCRPIKENLSAQYENAMAALKEGADVPVYSDYYRRLIQVDYRLAQEFYPINEAIAHALREVLAYYAYRRKPRRRPLPLPPNPTP